MADKLCILISTCERYRALAEFTRARIAEFWPGHPTVYFSGLAVMEHGLPLQDDPANWMQVTRSACRELLSRGYEKIYLILEDHPPFAPCHEVHLNETLPAAMDFFGAICIALSGPGQHRSWHGQPAKFHEITFDHVAESAQWKFSLHPALWNLAELEQLLTWMLENFTPADHNPWAFERKGGDPKSGLSMAWQTRSYRVVGSEMARPGYFFRRLPVVALQFAGDVAAFFIRILFGAEKRAKFDQAMRGIYCPYDGPYPLFWSGIMRKGVLSKDLQLWLKITGRLRQLDFLKGVAPAD